MKRIALAAGVLAAVVLGAPAAEARFIDLHAQANGGGIAGWGSSSTPDFFDHTRGAALGAEVGLKLLIFDLSAGFTQVFDGSGTSGTLSQVVFAVDIDVPVGDAKLPNGQSVNIIHPSLGTGFAFGTNGPVNPPLDASQISDKGIVVPLKVGYEYFLNPFMSVGAEGMFGYHYFFIGSSLNEHSSGFHFAGYGVLKFHLGY
jgi:hypothetical protein